MDSFVEFFKKYNDWADTVFGKDRAVPAMHHMKKEADEVIADIESGANPREEYADVLVLLINSAGSYGLTGEDLLIAAEAKLEKNKKRKWGAPDERGIVEHVKE